MSDDPGFKQKIRNVSNTRGRLIRAQKEDQEVALLCSKSVSVEAAVEDEWKVVYQIVISEAYQKKVFSLTHDSPMAGHLEVNNIYNGILTHFC